MKHELTPTPSRSSRGASQAPTPVIVLVSVVVTALCTASVCSWKETTQIQRVQSSAALVPSGSISTDYQPCNSPNPGDLSLEGNSSGESKVSSLTSKNGRSKIKLDFIPVSERRERANRGFPSVTAPEGAYGIEGHGSPDAVFCRTGEPMTARELANWIVNDPRFRPGMTVYLLCCETGKGKRPFAQKLADTLGSEVVAPTEKLWPLQTGLYVVAQERTRKSMGVFDVGVQRADISRLGEMRTFHPSAGTVAMDSNRSRTGRQDTRSMNFSSSSAAAPILTQNPPKKPLLRPGAKTAALLAGIHNQPDTTVYLNDGTKGSPIKDDPANRK